jgi:hypothetical protein
MIQALQQIQHGFYVGILLSFCKGLSYQGNEKEGIAGGKSADSDIL